MNLRREGACFQITELHGRAIVEVMNRGYSRTHPGALEVASVSSSLFFPLFFHILLSRQKNDIQLVVRLLPPSSYYESGPVEAGVVVECVNISPEKAKWVKLSQALAGRLAAWKRVYAGMYIADESCTGKAFHATCRRFTQDIFDSFPSACRKAVNDRLSLYFPSQALPHEALEELPVSVTVRRIAVPVVSAAVGVGVSGLFAKWMIGSATAATDTVRTDNFPWWIVSAVALGSFAVAWGQIVVEWCTGCGRGRAVDEREKELIDWYLPQQPWSVTWYAFMLAAVLAAVGIAYTHVGDADGQTGSGIALQLLVVALAWNVVGYADRRKRLFYRRPWREFIMIGNVFLAMTSLGCAFEVPLVAALVERSTSGAATVMILMVPNLYFWVSSASSLFGATFSMWNRTVVTDAVNEPPARWLEKPWLPVFAKFFDASKGIHPRADDKSSVAWDMAGFAFVLIFPLIFGVLRYLQLDVEAAFSMSLLAVNILCGCCLLVFLKYVVVPHNKLEHTWSMTLVIERNASLLLFAAQLSTTIWWALGTTDPDFSTGYVSVGQVSIVLDVANLLLWHPEVYALSLRETLCGIRLSLPRKVLGAFALGNWFSHCGLLLSPLFFLQATARNSIHAFVVAAILYNLVAAWRFLTIADQLISGKNDSIRR